MLVAMVRQWDSDMLASYEYKPFDAATFFSSLRQTGAAPRTDGKSISQIQEAHVNWEMAERMHEWAYFTDPDRAIQIAHAKRAWALRPQGVESVELG